MGPRFLSSRIFFATLLISIGVAAAACGSADNTTRTTTTTANETTASGGPAATASPSVAASPPGKLNGAGEAGSGHMMESSPGAASAPYDLQFLDTMSAHHQGAVEMAMVAETKSGREELKTLAAKMVTDQQKEIAQLKEWRNQWYAGKPEAVNMEMTGMMNSMMGMDMKKMGAATGNDFDLMFIDMMIPHHQGAVEMAREALTKAEHPEIKRFAQAVIKAQQSEISQMNKWKAAWGGSKATASPAAPTGHQQGSSHP
ncbi:MAG TPA: DUF305 domain-containing protein [Gaiellaceae bacterium]|nr:DUF305 domain-containing protein [Gaiellaceae bacterium]